MLRLVVTAAVVLMVMVNVEGACRHWCPAKGRPGSVYCCDDGSGDGDFAVHPGKCPHRPVCPPSFFGGSSKPTVCAHDGQCARNEKCCPDACLSHHTCLLAD